MQLINASARHELLSANQQLLDFQLNRFVNKHHRQRTLRKAISTKQQTVTETNLLPYHPMATSKLHIVQSNNNLHYTEIHEETELEEAGTTHKKPSVYDSQQSRLVKR